MRFVITGWLLARYFLVEVLLINFHGRTITRVLTDRMKKTHHMSFSNNYSFRANDSAAVIKVHFTNNVVSWLRLNSENRTDSLSLRGLWRELKTTSVFIQ